MSRPGAPPSAAYCGRQRSSGFEVPLRAAEIGRAQPIARETKNLQTESPALLLSLHWETHRSCATPAYHPVETEGLRAFHFSRQWKEASPNRPRGPSRLLFPCTANGGFGGSNSSETTVVVVLHLASAVPTKIVAVPTFVLGPASATRHSGEAASTGAGTSPICTGFASASPRNVPPQIENWSCCEITAGAMIPCAERARPLRRPVRRHAREPGPQVRPPKFRTTSQRSPLHRKAP